MVNQGQRSKLWKLLIVAAVVLLPVIAAVVLHRYWPFTETAVRRELGEAASAQVSFRTFRSSYFPPGCVAEGVIFQRQVAGPPLIQIQRLTIHSNLFGLLHHHISLIRAEGARVRWEKVDARSNSSSRPTVVDRLVADDAVLEVPRKPPDEGLRFVFHKFQVTNLRGPRQSGFQAELDIPLPKGSVRVSGHFGPWNSSSPDKTALDGDYKLESASLDVFHSVQGQVSATGQFSGPFDGINVRGEASVPELVVASTRHGLPLQTQYLVKVHGTTGDVAISSVKARFGRDDLDVTGRIARDSEKKRIADLDISCDRGRIEDTFFPFIHSQQSPITGAVRFRMHVTIPPGKVKFEERIGLTSTFRIEDARFTHKQTQLKLSKIAEAPDQDRPDTAARASLQGQVKLQDGIAKFSALQVEDQDASASLRGKFGLLDHRVDMHGELKTAASLAKTTQGIKAVFAKVLEPFFKKKPHETVVPIKIGGTYSHPQFGLDLSKKM